MVENILEKIGREKAAETSLEKCKRYGNECRQNENGERKERYVREWQQRTGERKQ